MKTSLTILFFSFVSFVQAQMLLEPHFIRHNETHMKECTTANSAEYTKYNEAYQSWFTQWVEKKYGRVRGMRSAVYQMSVSDLTNMLEYTVENTNQLGDYRLIEKRIHAKKFYIVILENIDNSVYDIKIYNNHTNDYENSVEFRPEYIECEIVGSTEYHGFKKNTSTPFNYTYDRKILNISEKPTSLIIDMIDGTSFIFDFCYKNKKHTKTKYVYGGGSDYDSSVGYYTYLMRDTSTGDWKGYDRKGKGVKPFVCDHVHDFDVWNYKGIVETCNH